MVGPVMVGPATPPRKTEFHLPEMRLFLFRRGAFFCHKRAGFRSYFINVQPEALSGCVESQRPDFTERRTQETGRVYFGVMNEQVNMTQKGKDRLEEQLQYLKTTRREQISEYMGKAIEDGDLRESAAYDEARMQQSENEAKIAELEAQLERARIVSDDEIDTSAVGVGAKVVVENAQKKQMTVEIVGSFEVDVLKGKISDASPMGQGLMGKKAGQSATWPGPKGEVTMKVISVSYE